MNDRNRQTAWVRALYHMLEVRDALAQLSPDQRAQILSNPDVEATMNELLERAGSSSKRTKLPKGKGSGDPFEPFRFDTVMNELRSVVMHRATETDGASDIDWLLRILLGSPKLFESVREVDNFLANMTGAEHSTKSTGRDRIIDWYFKQIDAMVPEERNRVYYKIARYIFISARSNYREWKELLLRGGGD